ncbi:putative zinc metalloprotease YwhC [Paenibacillus sp. J31TS4]|uniref:site-2 protease family protein n=1 Tax=Paenibacillus sp. J31TS4 TaxID=2807195 RepID=UPI001B0363E7|nr:site-2 protease family protein [Paenibacillus sp. J31TS4]GIP39589.1 putative zinc metalloprotease YwhC [Paenibacillus sp. J31TS4]
MNNFLAFSFDQLPFVFLALILAFTLHEFAHAITADKFGDDTPRSMGRVTLNPAVHLDVLGTILIFLVGFGWAKPVLIRRSAFKKPRLMSVIVSVAGPLANLLLAFVGMLIMYLLANYGVFETMSPGLRNAVLLFLVLLIRLNFVLFLFNLLPLPPLDGYRILQEFLPLRARLAVQQYEQWAVYLFLLFVFIPPLYSKTIGAWLALRYPLRELLDAPLRALFGSGIDWIMLGL